MASTDELSEEVVEMKWWRRHRGKSRPVIRKDEMRNQSNGELMHKIERILEAGNDETMEDRKSVV